MCLFSLTSTPGSTSGSEHACAMHAPVILMRQLLLDHTAFQNCKEQKKMAIQLSLSEEQAKAFAPLLCSLGLTLPLKEAPSIQEQEVEQQVFPKEYSADQLLLKKKKKQKSTEAQGAFLVTEKLSM